MARLEQIINEVQSLSWSDKRELRQALDDELEQQQTQHVQPAQSNVLGRHGFIEQMSLGLVDYEGKLYLDRYES
jgi:hypothetical protein